MQRRREIKLKLSNKHPLLCPICKTELGGDSFTLESGYKGNEVVCFCSTCNQEYICNAETTTRIHKITPLCHLCGQEQIWGDGLIFNEGDIYADSGYLCEKCKHRVDEFKHGGALDFTVELFDDDEDTEYINE